MFKDVIDLRSDTVTRPTEEMLNAMKNAEVGDDVLGDDPTVIELERIAAEITGKEKALFVCSGTMGNQISIRTQTSPGDEVIVEEDSHIFQYEAGGAAWNSGVQLKTIRGKYGVIPVVDIRKSIRVADVHNPVTSLLCLENTHNNSGGVVLPLEYIKDVKVVASDAGIRMHLDGARLFNASTASGIPVHEYCGYFDSVMVCLSKGLCSPVGSLIAGSADFIRKARRVRKVMGGGWRQAGYLASCGIISLTKMAQRLEEDHRKTKIFAELLDKVDGVEYDHETVQTNMIYFKIRKFTPEEFINKCSENKLLMLDHGEFIRAVFHKDVAFEDVPRSIEIIRNVLK